MSVVREGFGIGGAGVDGSYTSGVVVLFCGRAARAPRVLCGGRGARAAGVVVLLRTGRACCWYGGSVAGGLGVLLVWWFCCGRAARAPRVLCGGRAARAPSGCFCRSGPCPRLRVCSE